MNALCGFHLIRKVLYAIQRAICQKLLQVMASVVLKPLECAIIFRWKSDVLFKPLLKGEAMHNANDASDMPTVLVV